MEGVCAVVFVGGDVVGLAVHCEGGVLDAVGVAARDGAVVWVLAVDAVVACVVPAGRDLSAPRIVSGLLACAPKHNISLDTILVVDEEVADRGAVWHEASSDAFTCDLEFAILVWIRAGGAIALDGCVSQYTTQVGYSSWSLSINQRPESKEERWQREYRDHDAHRKVLLSRVLWQESSFARVAGSRLGHAEAGSCFPDAARIQAP